MKDICYDIWLQKVFINDPEKAYHIVSLFSSAKAFYEAREKLSGELSFLTDGDRKRLKSVSLKSAALAEEKCRLKNIEIIKSDSEYFPSSFEKIKNPPYLIYAFGNKELLKEGPVISVVGPRKADGEALLAAMHFSYDFASVGITVCSGVATGIDAAAIKGAIKADGKTIGIMACSLDVNYPAATRETKKEILSSDGVLISEYPPTERAYASNFHPRNRLMSGIADAVLAVKAPERSGTLITASHAAEQGKELYVIPWSIYDKSAVGSNKLILDGATPVFSSEEIFLPLVLKYPDKINIKKHNKNSINIFKKQGLGFKESEHAKIKKNPILSSLERGPLSFDELSEKTEMGASLLNAELIKLEIEGYLELEEDGKYSLKI
jgi:DNA processing protein